MRSLGLAGLLLLAACGQPAGGPDASFSPTSATLVAAPGPAAASTAPARGDASLANIRPSVIERIRSEPPVPVHTATSTLSEGALFSLSDPALEVIKATPPKAGFFGASGREHFSAGLVNGAISRVQVNGLDFALLEGGGFAPDRRGSTYALIALRAGCTYNGQARVEKVQTLLGPAHLWYVGLRC